MSIGTRSVHGAFSPPLYVLLSVPTTSFIYFSVNTSGKCTYLSISNGSNNL